MRGAELLFLGFLASGCFVSPQDDAAQLQLALRAPFTTPQPSDAVGGDAWDHQGRFYLEKWPRFVRVGVELDDYELSSGSWPAPPKGENDGYLDQQGTYASVIELELPAGKGRQLSAAAYDLQDEAAVFYREEKRVTIDLQAGRAQTAVLELVKAPTAEASISLRCDDQMPRPQVTVSLSLVDSLAQVVLPSRKVGGYPPYLEAVSWQGLPLNRPLRGQVVLTNELTKAAKIVELVANPSTLTEAGQIHSFKLEIPCDV